MAIGPRDYHAGTRADATPIRVMVCVALLLATAILAPASAWAQQCSEGPIGTFTCQDLELTGNFVFDADLILVLADFIN